MRGALMFLSILLKHEDEATALFLRIGNASPFLALPFNAPAVVVLDKFHFRSFSPPPVDFTRKRQPNPIPLFQIPEIVEQGFINPALTCAVDTVRVHDEIHQAMIFHDQRNLLLPSIERIVLKDVKERVVLRHRDREFEKLAIEKWKDGATTAPLRIEVCH